GAPTSAYRLLKGDKRKAAIAAGARKAYRPLFDAEEDAQTLPIEKLKSLVAQVAGTDDDMTGRIASTFSTLVQLGDFEAEKDEDTEEIKTSEKEIESDEKPSGKTEGKGLRTEFHYNIQVHLPSNGTEEVYLNIFNAIRKTFQ